MESLDNEMRIKRLTIILLLFVSISPLVTLVVSSVLLGVFVPSINLLPEQERVSLWFNSVFSPFIGMIITMGLAIVLIRMRKRPTP